MFTFVLHLMQFTSSHTVKTLHLITFRQSKLPKLCSLWACFGLLVSNVQASEFSTEKTVMTEQEPIISAAVVSNTAVEKAVPNTLDTHQRNQNSCVILLHGLARSPRAFSAMARTLREAGNHVVNQGYPSRHYPIADLSKKAFAEALPRCQGDTQSQKTIHIVTHSMGGILTRNYLKDNTIDNLGRVVMLGPPNQGSELVDKLAWLKPFEWLNGPAGLQLGTSPQSLVSQLPKADYDLGVIAGDKTFNLVLSQLLPKPNDGKVTVESTKIEGMRDHIVMPVTHTFMMQNTQVMQQVQHYLVHGKFDHALKPEAPKTAHYTSSDID